MRLLILAAGLLTLTPALLFAQQRRASDKPLVTHISTADAAAHVFRGQLYVYVSHDTDAHAHAGSDSDEATPDYHLLRLDGTFGAARDLGPVLRPGDVPWAVTGLRAPDAAEKDDRYYIYFSARDTAGIFRIGVATAESPEGPFRAAATPIAGSYGTDPAVFSDDDGRRYLYFSALPDPGSGGHSDSGAHRLEANRPAPGPMIAKLRPDMTSFAGEAEQILINDSTGAPISAGDHARRYFDGAWVHKYKERYYLSYSTGNSHRIVYATSRSPYGPFTYRGVLLPPVAGWTTHASIVSFRGRCYLFYHERMRSGGNPQLRSVKMTGIGYDAGGRMFLMGNM